MQRVVSGTSKACRSWILWGAAIALLVLPSRAGAQTNLALNRPATASAGSEYPANEAFDGNVGTRWASAQGVDPQWIYVDLGATTSVGRVVLRWETASAKSYQIQTSNDAVNWTSIYSTTTGAGGTETLTVSGSGRYVRMYGTVRNTAYGYSLWELEVYAPTTTPGANVALGKATTASSTQSGFPGSSAVDGNNGTRWASNSGVDPQWIYVDLAATTAIARVRLSWEVAYGKSYQIQTSNDATNWTTIFSTTTGDGGIDDLTGLAGSGRYVRMNGTARGTAFGYSLWEFEVYSSGATPTATSRPTATATATTRATATATATATTRGTATATTRATATATPRPTATSTATATTATRATATATSVTCSGNTNIALNKPAYSWYYQDNAREPKYAVNGTRDGGAADNRWASPWMPNAWIYVDLGAVATINSVQLYWEAAYAIDYDLQTSNDAVTWTTVRAVRGNAATANTQTFSPAVKGRYLRMYGITRATTFGYSLYEFEIYGCGDNPNVTPVPPPSPLTGTYALNWSDEFDGTALDLNKWAYDPGAPQNNESETYTTDTQNIRVAGGALTLEAHDTQDNGQACNGCRFTSGRIRTFGKKTAKYGRLAARMQLPVAPGMWPAFWGLGVDLDTVGWPNCGELDVMENIGYSDWVSGALHGPGYFGAGSVGGLITMPSTVANFHEYRVDWDPTYVQWYIDSTLVLTANRADVVATRGQWVFDHDFYLILNLAMGGDYPAGYNGASTPFYGLPQSTVDMLPLRANVDYVRIYQKQ